MTKLTPLRLLLVAEYFNIINWENLPIKTVENESLIPWQNLTVTEFFTNTNWSGISNTKTSLEKSDLSLKDLSCLSVEEFFKFSNWKGVVNDLIQEEKPLSLSFTVQDFFQAIKWEYSRENFMKKEEFFPSFIHDEKSFSLNDLSDLF